MNNGWRNFIDLSAGVVSDHGKVYLSCGLQGRIFAELDGELLHKLDCELAAHPHPRDFNNIGGNSLWPAPEGGAFAFNYGPGSDAWVVQEGINRACPELLEDGARGRLRAAKAITLVNHHGTAMPVRFERTAAALPLAETLARYGVRGTGYRSVDTWTLETPCDPEAGVIAAWSLEQFYGSDGVTAFGRVAGDPKRAINADFYGDPWPRLDFSERQFAFRLGGEARLQIGISMAEDPEWIGAWLPERELVILRHTAKAEGRYINIADNAQPCGIYGAQDQYSIFNGATLGFFELETIAPMRLTPEGKVSGSELVSETLFFRGSPGKLKQLLLQEFQIIL